MCDRRYRQAAVGCLHVAILYTWKVSGGDLAGRIFFSRTRRSLPAKFFRHILQLVFCVPKNLLLINSFGSSDKNPPSLHLGCKIKVKVVFDFFLISSLPCSNVLSARRPSFCAPAVPHEVFSRENQLVLPAELIQTTRHGRVVSAEAAKAAAPSGRARQGIAREGESMARS